MLDHHAPRSDLTRALAIAYTLALVATGAANIGINYYAKGWTWDLYPVAECVWVLCSIAVVAVTARASPRRLVLVLIALQFLDSFVDACAMGHPTWWAGRPVLIEWEWEALRTRGHLYPAIYAYWACTWALQVPWRCVAIARAVTGRWDKPFLLIALGLNVIWLTAPQDVLYFFVWTGPYDPSIPYFSYLPPEGTWNLRNMLLLRVPIGVTAGSLLVWAGMRTSRACART